MAATQEPTSYFSMPGSFHSEGVHPGLIRPPASPAATASSPIFASAILTPASPSTPSALPRPKYKRRRPGDDSSNVNNPNAPEKGTGTSGQGQAAPHWDSATSTSRNGAAAVPRSYVLAGNLDTPGVMGVPGGAAGQDALADHGFFGESMFSDSDYRTVLGSKRRREDLETDHTAPTTLYTLPSHPSQKGPGWGSLAFSTLGGVVGKVWDFCWGSSFKGFHAGSGQGYDAPEFDFCRETDTIGHLPGAWNQEEDDDEAEKAHRTTQAAFHGDGFTESADYNPSTSNSRASTPPRQPAKRRQTDKADDLGRNWVVINQHESGRASPATGRPSIPRTSSSSRQRASGATPTARRVTSGPMSRVSGYSGSPAQASRLSARRSSSRGGRHSVASQGWEKPPAASTASYASPRSSPVGTPREQSFRGDVHQNTPSRRRTAATPNSSMAGAPESRATRPGHRRSNSNASAATTRSPHGTDSVTARGQSPKSTVEGGNKGGEDDVRKQSPRLTEEARRLAAKRRMEERDADVRIAAFNRRLQDMIRQGKEALGTTVDVEMEGPADGAWEDDE